MLGSLLSNNEYVTTLTSDPLWKAIKTFSHKHRRSSMTGSTVSGGGSSYLIFRGDRGSFFDPLKGMEE